MPALPVITDTFRVTLDWSPAGGVQPANVLHFFSAGLNEGGISAALEAHLDPRVVDCVSNNFDILGVTVLALDGTSASQTFAWSTVITGGSTGEFSPASCGLVKFQTAQRGPRGRGRMFCGPVAESAMADGLLGTATGSDMFDGWAASLPALATADCALVVASYAHHDQNAVTAVTVERVLGTQKRRQDQLR